MIWAFLLLILVVLALILVLVAGARRAREHALHDDWRARTATLEGAGSHLSTRPD